MFKRTKKLTKRGLVLLGVLICATALALGAVITFYANLNVTTGTIDVLLEYSEDDSNWVACEEATPTITFENMVPGDSNTTNRWVKISGKINKDHTINFTLSKDSGCTADMVGTTLTLYDNTTGTPVEIATCTDGVSDWGTITFTKGHKAKLELVCDIDNYYDTEEGTEDLSWDIEIERNAVMP